MLAKHYGWEPFMEPVVDNPYLSDYYKDIKRWSFALEVFFLKQRFKDILNINASDKTIIQDRSIFEGVYIFAANNRDMGNMDDRDFETYMELFGQIDPARGNANVGEALWTGNVTVGEERQPKLYAVSMRAVNANSEQIIEETVLKGEAAIRNDDTEFFNNKISFFIFQYNTASKRYYSLKRTNSIVRIEAGETKTIPFQFDDLEPDGKYMVIAYISAEEDGLEEIEGSSRSAEYTIQLPSGIRLVESDCVNRDTRVFDLSGRRIPSASLSKGLYIIQGHKIVAK